MHYLEAQAFAVIVHITCSQKLSKSRYHHRRALLRNTKACVSNFHSQLSVLYLIAYINADLAIIGVLDGVLHQVDHDLLKAVNVSNQLWNQTVSEGI